VPVKEVFVGWGILRQPDERCTCVADKSHDPTLDKLLILFAGLFRWKALPRRKE
jgi:hypothetical protein